MRKPGVEDERLRLAKRIDDAVQEANEERGVEAHRTGRIEQDNQAQRLDLAAAPSELHRRSTMRYAAVDGPAQVEAPPAASHLLAANEPCAHGQREAHRQLVDLRDIRGIDDVA